MGWKDWFKESVPQGEKPMTIVPTRLGIIVLNKDDAIEPTATQTIRDNRELELKQFQRASFFSPILQIRINGRIEERRSLIVKFEIRKGNFTLLSGYEAKVLARDLVFYPDMRFDLAEYKPTNRKFLWWNREVPALKDVTGSWSLVTSHAVVENAFISDAGNDFYSMLRFSDFGTFRWEILTQAEPLNRLVTATGELQAPPKENGSNKRISITDI